MEWKLCGGMEWCMRAGVSGGASCVGGRQSSKAARGRMVSGI